EAVLVEARIGEAQRLVVLGDAGTGGSRVSGSAAYFITSAAGTYSTTLTVSGTGSPTSTAVGVGFR
ncbi:MAG: hypothetical protein AAB250_04485, partial [Bdellovibrionota bacterium]